MVQNFRTEEAIRLERAANMSGAKSAMREQLRQEALEKRALLAVSSRSTIV